MALATLPREVTVRTGMAALAIGVAIVIKAGIAPRSPGNVTLAALAREVTVRTGMAALAVGVAAVIKAGIAPRSPGYVTLAALAREVIAGRYIGMAA